MVKYLVVYGKSITIYSFNILLGFYTCLVDSGIEDRALNTTYGIWNFAEDLYNDLLKACNCKDKSRIKELLFGPVCDDEVDLYECSADLGTYCDGSLITAKHVKRDANIPSVCIGIRNKLCIRSGVKYDFGGFGFDSTIIRYIVKEGNIKDNEVGRLRLKMALTGQSLHEYKYDYGWIGIGDMVLTPSKHIFLQDITIKNKDRLEINDVCLINVTLFRLSNLSIKYLLDSSLRKIDNCNCNITYIIFTKLPFVHCSKLNIDNAANVDIEVIDNSHIIFNKSVYKLSITSSINKTTIEFNCNINKDSFQTFKERIGTTIGDSTFIFKRDVDAESLLSFFKYYISYSDKLSIQVNSDIYDRCMHDERFTSVMHMIGVGKW